MDSNIVITISREYGSGGLSIGRRLAELCDIPFYSRDDIANLGKQEPFLTEANCLWLTENDLRPSALPGSAFSFGSAYGEIGSQLFLKEANVVWKLAKKGPCVIVGRCADFILQSRPHTYRIFLSSGIPNRLQHIRQYPAQYPADIKKEAKEILQMDKKRAAYYNYYTGQVWGKASNYDLCIDTGKLGLQTANLLVDFIQRVEQLSFPK